MANAQLLGVKTNGANDSGSQIEERLHLGHQLLRLARLNNPALRLPTLHCHLPIFRHRRI
jgi:hypothetical protein